MRPDVLDLPALVSEAETRIRPYVVQTPLEPSPALSDLSSAHVFCKLENLQHTGSFKLRGALNKLLSLHDDERPNCVVTASTGNHGAAVALATAKLGISSIVYVPEGASPAKVANMRRFGADVRFFGTEAGASDTFAKRYARENGLAYVSAYDDWDIIAGQGTIGLEAERQSSVAIDVMIAPLGGGGLVSGIAAYFKSARPNAHVVAVSPRNSKAMIESVRAGKIIQTEHLPTIADGTSGGLEEGAITFDLCRHLVDEFVEVEEDEIKSAMRLFIESHHMLLEGAGALGIAGLRRSRHELKGKTVAVIISGANISADRLKEAL